MRTKRRIPGIMVLSLFLIVLLGACGSRNASDVTPVSKVQDKTVPVNPVPSEPVPSEPVSSKQFRWKQYRRQKLA